MFLTDRKLDRRAAEIKNYRYRDIKKLETFAVKEDMQGIVNPELPRNFEDWEEKRLPEKWTGRDRYLWMHKNIRIPEEWKGKRALGIFDFGRTGVGNNEGFEALLYVDGHPYQGVDGNHKEVFFDESLYGKEISLIFRLWSGLEGGGVPRELEHICSQADLAWLDEKIDDLYYMGTMVLETIKILKEEDPIRHELQKALDAAFHCIDWSYPGSEEFYESVYQADDLLNQKIDAMDKHSLVRVNCVGHTHMDHAWLWRIKHTREKCSRSFSTVLRLMEQYPEYIFMHSQPQQYENIKKDFPEIYAKMQQKAKEGQWETGGAMWVEADCNLTSGESLTRQILLGSKFFKDEFNQETEFLWLPDVFGYSWALPQILKKAGIEMFMTTKISWNQYNRMPHDTFIWKGIDGSEVITHFITTPCPWNEPGSWFYTYNGELLPFTVKGVWDAYQEKDMNQELLISYGYGDGGGGVNRDMLEYRRRIDKIPGLPSCKTSKASDYFRRLKETVKNTDQYVHTWDGELYLEYHRGTYTSQGYNKRMNRRMELLYREAEWMTAMAAMQNGNLAEAKQEELTGGWKEILTNQFHDIIPGSSIHEVYEDCKKDYPRIQAIAEAVEQDAKAVLFKEEEACYTAVNTSAWEHGDLVYLPDGKRGIYRDEAGNKLTTQAAKKGIYVEIPKIPAMGCAAVCYEAAEDKEENAAFTINGRNIETPFYSIEFNKYGQITRLYDKDFDREVLPKGERANVLQMFEDKPLDNDAWDIDIFYQQKMREITELTDYAVTACGPLQMTIHMEWNYMNSKIAQDVLLYSRDRRIDFSTKVDYHEKHQLLKAAFPVDIRSTYATYDVQYGNVRRPNHWNTSWDQARFESVAHRWVDLSERNYGVSLLNDCKYGHDVKDNVIRISLLKAATHPDHLQDQGEHEFTYALLPHGGDFIEGNIVEEAYRLNWPMQAVKGRAMLPYESFLSFDSREIELDAVKKSEDGAYLVVRFHEFAGSHRKVKMTTGFTYSTWQESDLRERPIEEAHADEVKLDVKPYEIKTLLFKL